MYSIQFKDGIYFFSKEGKLRKRRFQSILAGIRINIQLVMKQLITPDEYIPFYEQLITLPLPLVISSDKLGDKKFTPITSEDIFDATVTLLGADKLGTLIQYRLEDYPEPTLIMHEESLEEEIEAFIIYKEWVIEGLKTKTQALEKIEEYKEDQKISLRQYFSLKEQIATSRLPKKVIIGISRKIDQN
jgi:hypothetical protein